jgi:hypothetical protein
MPGRACVNIATDDRRSRDNETSIRALLNPPNERGACSDEIASREVRAQLRHSRQRSSTLLPESRWIDADDARRGAGLPQTLLKSCISDGLRRADSPMR